MKVILTVFVILALLQSLQANSFEQCFRELDRQLVDLDKNLTVGFPANVAIEQDRYMNKHAINVQTCSKRELDEPGKQSSVTILQLTSRADSTYPVINALFTVCSNIVAILPDIVGGMIPPTGGTLYSPRHIALHMLLDIMDKVYTPFLESSKKIERILKLFAKQN